MNMYSIIGFTSAIFVLITGLKLSSKDLSIFIDFPSIFIVIGGTIAATAITFELDQIAKLIKVFFYRMFFFKKNKYRNVVKEIILLCEGHRKGESLENRIGMIKDPFLKEGISMLNDGVMEYEEVLEMMSKRKERMLLNHMEEAKKIQTLGKYPPAFGMLGTTIGMIVLLANLGGKDAIKIIGPAMGVCLITTLYGIVIANMLLIPASENLITQSKETYTKNQIVVEGIRLLLQKTNPIIVAEELNSFLKPNERLDWKTILK